MFGPLAVGIVVGAVLRSVPWGLAAAFGAVIAGLVFVIPVVGVRQSSRMARLERERREARKSGAVVPSTVPAVPSRNPPEHRSTVISILALNMLVTAGCLLVLGESLAHGQWFLTPIGLIFAGIFGIKSKDQLRVLRGR